MLLRQALKQTRKGMPTPVLFNSLDPIDEVSVMEEEEVFYVHFQAVHNRTSIRSSPDDSAGQVRQRQPYHKAAAIATGAQAS
jgi:hypothetical protein